MTKKKKFLRINETVGFYNKVTLINQILNEMDPVTGQYPTLKEACQKAGYDYLNFCQTARRGGKYIVQRKSRISKVFLGDVKKYEQIR